MSEYIVMIPEYVPPFDPAVRAASFGEKIVRCRDCKYRRRSWNGHEPNFIDDWFCSYTGGHEVKPNGFCAWGAAADHPTQIKLRGKTCDQTIYDEFIAEVLEHEV